MFTFRFVLVVSVSILISSCGGVADKPIPTAIFAPNDPEPSSSPQSSPQFLDLATCTADQMADLAFSEPVLAIGHEGDDRIETILWFPASGKMCWRPESQQVLASTVLGAKPFRGGFYLALAYSHLERFVADDGGAFRPEGDWDLRKIPATEFPRADVVTADGNMMYGIEHTSDGSWYLHAQTYSAGVFVERTEPILLETTYDRGFWIPAISPDGHYLLINRYQSGFDSSPLIDTTLWSLSEPTPRKIATFAIDDGDTSWWFPSDHGMLLRVRSAGTTASSVQAYRIDDTTDQVLPLALTAHYSRFANGPHGELLVLIGSSTADGLFRTTVGSDGALTADLDAIGGCIRFCETMAFSRGGNGMFSWDDHGRIETDVLESDGHYRPRFIYQIRLPWGPGNALLYGIPK